MSNSDKKRGTILAVLIPAGASVVVALITTLGTIAARGGELTAARREATKTITRAEELAKALAASPLPVGSILASPLTPEEFAQAAGDPPIVDPTKSKWAFADGRQVVGSVFHELTHGKPVPDLRGMFLRGFNAGRSDAWKDPEIDRVRGSLQPWSTGMPRNTFATSSAGEHVHNGPQGTAGFVGGGAGQHANGPYGGPAYDAVAMSGAGGHVHSVAGGDTETRPNNISVFFYVRINA